MIKYMAAAVVLKAFSLNSLTCSGYRSLGNRFGQKKRREQSIEKYVERGDLLVELARKYDVLKDGTALVELGTGWIHWFGLYLALHVEGEVSLELYDVWDNRQLDALKGSFGKLAERWEQSDAVSARQCERLASIQTAGSFDELYQRFNANYTIDTEGSLAAYPDETYDAITSFHVMEHVGRSFIEQSIGDMFRILKPGGYCIHQIGIDDHLAHYDSKVSKKNYLRYSLSKRKYLFENVVQYHNVLQGADYQRFFSNAGFDIVEVDRERCDISGLRIHADWADYSRDDQETTIFTIVCRRPL
jgi:SAM-dependent methyltransferase